MHHLANVQNMTGPASLNTGQLFMSFGRPVCADRISNCPLGRVLTYKVTGTTKHIYLDSFPDIVLTINSESF